jgi:hypothetical protein
VKKRPNAHALARFYGPSVRHGRQRMPALNLLGAANVVGS